MGIEGISSSKQMTAVEKVQTVKPVQQKEEVHKEPQEEKETKPLSRESLKKEIDSVNQFLKSSNTSLKFQLHDKLHKYYVQIVDSTTQEVIKEIPPKKFLDMYANMMEQIGLLVDHRI